MRFALVSDIHANLQAWNAVLEDIGTLGIDEIINLGDVVGYGSAPSEVVSSVSSLCSISVLGNHDAVCALRMDPSVFNDQAREAIEWTQQQLDEKALDFLKETPEMARPADNSFLATHAEVCAPLDFGYILTAEDAERNFAACADSIIFIGHTHRPGVFLLNPSGEVTLHEPGEFNCDSSLRYIINPGSVGDPRSEDIVASYCIFDSETRDVEFRRVAFDIDAYRQAIDASGLTARPFFLRYLDAINDPGENLIPAVSETDVIPQFNLGVQMPALKQPKAKKSRKPIIVIMALVLCAGALAWFMSSGSGKSSEATDAEITDAAPEVITTFPVTARYVRISDPKGEVLSLAEVEVFCKHKNVARDKEASQSSTHSDRMRASKAVDGIRDGSTTDRITHTLKKRPIWWEVDLGEEYAITTITIWNRNESKKLMKRLDGFTLEMFDDQRRLVFVRKNNAGATPRINVE